MAMPQDITPQDGLGQIQNPDALRRFSPQELATTIGGYREGWQDLSSLVQDLDAVGMISDGSAHPWAPMVMHRLGHHLQHGHHVDGHLGHLGHVIHRLMSHLHAVMARHVDLEREKKLWHAKSNVVQTMYWQQVAANSVSTTATVSAPYSGVNYMVLDVLMDTVLTPPGFWTNISFASINFAQSGNTIKYGTPGASGVQGIAGGIAGGMGFEPFLQDKTAPEGCRGWNPWTGWILSSDAVSTWQWANADVANPRDLRCSILMRSSPCDTAGLWLNGNAGGVNGSNIPWAGFPAGYGAQHGAHALDMMYAGVLGLTGALRGPPAGWFNGQQIAHTGSWGSAGPGFGAVPSGHSGPANMAHGGGFHH